MEKPQKSKQYRRNAFKAFRILTAAALICTVLLVIFILAESATPGEASAKQSDYISEQLMPEETEDPVPTIKLQTSLKAHFIGEKDTIELGFVPLTATDRDLVYSSLDENVAEVNELGEVTFKGVGASLITVSLRSNPKVKSEVYAICYGARPEAGDTLTLKKSKFTEGKTSDLEFFNGESEIKASAFEVSIDNKKVIKYSVNSVFPQKEGKAVITLKYPETGYEQSFNITVKDNPEYVKPQSFAVSEDVINVPKSEYFYLKDYVEGVLPEGAPKNFKAKVISESRNNVLVGATSTSFYAKHAGSAQIELISRYNSKCKKTITVNVIEEIPTTLKIVGAKRMVIDNSAKLRAYGKTDYIDNVEWKIVNGKASISKDGVLTANHLGTVKVQAVSTVNNEVAAEIEIRVSLYETFKLFVRKIIGHFLLFTVLGFGFAGCYFLLLKRKWLFPLHSAATSFIIAVISEALQLPIFTEGRVATWTDVVVDTVGAVLGIIIAAAVIILYLLINRAASPKNYKTTLELFKQIRIGKLYKPEGRILAEYDCEYKRE